MEDDVKMEDDNNSKEEEAKVQKKAVNKNHLFENDDYEQVLINAVWYNKSMPKKRKNADYSLNTRAARARA